MHGNTPAPQCRGCGGADGVVRRQNRVCAHPRTATRWREPPRHASATRVCKRVRNGAGRPHRPAAGGQRRWQRELSSLSPSDCLLRDESHAVPVPRFPHRGRRPRALLQERSQTVPGCPLCPGVPEPPEAHRPAHSALHACAHAGHTCHFPHARAHPDALCTGTTHTTPTPQPSRAPAVHTRVRPHTCWDHTRVPARPPPPVPAACAWAPRQLCAPAAPRCSVSLATLRIYQWRHCGKTLPERREEGGGGSVGAGGGQTGGRGGPWGAVVQWGGCVCSQGRCTGVCGGAAVCTHVCKLGGVAWLFPPHPPPRLSQPLGATQPPQWAPQAVGGLRALRGGWERVLCHPPPAEGQDLPPHPWGG